MSISIHPKPYYVRPNYPAAVGMAHGGQCGGGCPGHA